MSSVRDAGRAARWLGSRSVCGPRAALWDQVTCLNALYSSDRDKAAQEGAGAGEAAERVPGGHIISENVMITANIYRDVVSKHAEEFNTLRKELQYR